MPAHFPHTPEALLGRNDSKNPATTCKGITSSGRACRRALASNRSSPDGRRKSSVSAFNGVVALVEEDGRVQEADFYCWQHKDQAEARAQVDQEASKTRPHQARVSELYPLQERNSIDTLIQRLGIDASSSSEEQRYPPKIGRQQQSEKAQRPPRRTGTHDFAYSQSATPQQDINQMKYEARPATKQNSRRKKKVGFWQSLCCMAEDDGDYVEIVRHRKRVEQSTRPRLSDTVSTPPLPSMRASKPKDTPSMTQAYVSNQDSEIFARPALQHRQQSNPQTSRLLSFIPQQVSPQTTSALLAELIKPLSPHDEEGYI